MNPKVQAAREALAGKILDMIATGEIKRWLQDWRALDAPYNAISKQNYRGINVLHLSFAPYKDSRWLTFKQAAERGWKVKKGEHARTVEKWTWFTTAKDGEADSPESKRPIVQYFNVFNAEQVEGIPLLNKTGRKLETVKQAEDIIHGCPVSLNHGGATACYDRWNDKIIMPLRESFFADTGYYSTLFHEMSHSTGHENRLNRDGVTSMFASKGSEIYAFEELVAEFSATFICKETGTQAGEDYDNHLESHSAYIQSWSKHLNKDLILQAISQANKAANMVLGWGEIVGNTTQA